MVLFCPPVAHEQTALTKICYIRVMCGSLGTFFKTSNFDIFYYIILNNIPELNYVYFLMYLNRK